MNFKIDDKKRLDYELEAGLRKWVNFILIPIINNLPVFIRPYVTKDKAADEVVENRTSHYALEILYQKGYNIKKPKKFIEKLARSVWFGANNAKAVRNRLRLVKDRVYSHFAKLAHMGHKEISALSIAAGSARAMLEEGDKLLKKHPDMRLNFVFIDKNPAALEYSRKFAQDLGLLDKENVKIRWYEDTATNFLQNHNENFDLVEMVGLLDYFDDERTVRVFTHIQRILKAGGLFITANIAPNKEQKFVTKFVDWKMIYRNHQDMRRLLVQSGFSDDNIELIYEPLRVHIVALATK